MTCPFWSHFVSRVPKSGLLRTGATLAFLFVVAPDLDAATFHVPSSHSTIQEAVDLASPGDSILVAPGTYTGIGNRDIRFFGKDVRVVSEGGPSVTVIDCEREGRGFDIRGGESNAALIEGFTITNGLSVAPIWPGSFAAGISCRGLSHPTIRDCILVGNEARQAGGLGCADSSPVLENCLIVGNLAWADGGGASILNFSDPIMIGCLIVGNRANVGGGVRIDRGQPSFESCTIASNWADDSGGGVAIQLDSTGSFLQTILFGNCAAVGSDVALMRATSAIELDCCAIVDEGISLGEGMLFDLGDRVTSDPELCLLSPCANAPTAEGDFSIADTSPCTSQNSPCGSRIGVFEIGCGEPAGLPDPLDTIRVESWGGIKYRLGR